MQGYEEHAKEYTPGVFDLHRQQQYSYSKNTGDLLFNESCVEKTLYESNILPLPKTLIS